jgi:hypothetical protein
MPCLLTPVNACPHAYAALLCHPPPHTHTHTQAALDAAGLRGSALGRADVSANPEVPDWLKKWAVLTLQFVRKEKELLPGVRGGGGEGGGDVGRVRGGEWVGDG